MMALPPLPPGSVVSCVRLTLDPSLRWKTVVAFRTDRVCRCLTVARSTTVSPFSCYVIVEAVLFRRSKPVPFSRQLQEQIEGWADDFGGDFELKVTGQRVIFVTGAEDIRRILLSRPTKFKRGWTPVRHAIRYELRCQVVWRCGRRDFLLS